jgi:hypothetical protein
MTWLIDGVAFVGGGLMTAGVFLQFGLAWSLMFGGSFLVSMAVYAAKKHEAMNVSDS